MSAPPTAESSSYSEWIGPHHMLVVGDFVHFRFHGPYLPEEATRAMDLMAEFQAKHECMYLLIDLTEAGMPTMETRRILAQAATRMKTIISVYYGANFVTRAMAVLIHRVMSILSKSEKALYFVADESEGRRQIAKCRAAQAQSQSR